MHAASLCFWAALVQLLIGITLTLANMPAHGFMIGVSPLLLVGAVLVISGMATFLVGSVVGLLTRKREGAPASITVFAALNGTLFLFLTVLGAIGMVMQQVERARLERHMADYQKERDEKKIAFAESFFHTYHDSLWNQRVLLLTTSELSDKMQSRAIAGMILVVVPQIDWQSDKAGDHLLDGSSYFVNRLVMQLLQADDRTAFTELRSYFREVGISYAVDLQKEDGGFKSFRDEEFDWFAKRETVIKRLQEKNDWDDQYRKGKGN